VPLNRETIIRMFVAALVIGALFLAWPYITKFVGLDAKPSAPPPATTGSPGPASTPTQGTPRPDGPKAPVLKAEPVTGAGAAKTVHLGSDTFEGDYDLALEVDPKGATVRGLTLARARFFRTVADYREPPDQREPMILIDPAAPPAFAISEVRVCLNVNENVDVQFDKATNIGLEGQGATNSELKVGMRAYAYGQPDQAAKQILAFMPSTTSTAPGKPAPMDATAPLCAEGSIAAVGTGSITITTSTPVWSKINLSDVIWKTVQAGPAQAVASVTVKSVAVKKDEADKALFEVRKQYTVFAVTPKDGKKRQSAPPQYQMKMMVKFLSIDSSVQKIVYTLDGPPAMPADPGRGGAPTAIVGKWKGDAVATDPNGNDYRVVPTGLKPGEPLPPVKNLAGPEVAWIAQMDKYFAVVVIPRNSVTTPPGANPHDTFAAGADAVWYSVSTGPTPQAMPQVQLVSRERQPKAGEIVHEYDIYAGPKDDGQLEKMYGPLNLKGLIAWSAPCCGAIPLPYIDLLSRGLMVVLEFFHDILRNYGLAIMLLVVLLRLALHPITRWSTKSMLEMQKLGPKMQEIREKYADDQQKMREEMQKVGGFKAMGGCLPMFLQMPIWIALYTGLYVAIQLRHAAFIPADWLPVGSLFLQDLSAPDMMFHWQAPFFLPGANIDYLGAIIRAIQGFLTGDPGVGLTSINILPVLMGVSMYLQQKFTPQPPSTNPQMQSQKTMMNLMSVFFALMLYSAPAGLNLYIATSTALGLVEQRYIKRRIAHADAVKAAADATAAKPGTPPDDKKPAKAVSAVAGRNKSLGERIQAWVHKKIDQGRQAEDQDAKRRGKK
jgi:YidC/Oxa1 family membrane protein insertase